MKKGSLTVVCYFSMMVFLIAFIIGIMNALVILKKIIRNPNYYAVVKNDTTTTLPLSYKNDQYDFALQYTTDFDFYEMPSSVNAIRAGSYIPACDPDTSVACLLYARDKHYPNTNFDSAGFSVNRIAGAATWSACYSLTDRGYPGEATAAKAINGTVFQYAEVGDAATGHYATDRLYRVFRNTDCLEINLRVATSNFQNYNPGLGVKEFTKSDEATVWQKLSTVLNTVKFSEPTTATNPLPVDKSCSKDSDCIIVNKDDDPKLCWAGYCGARDYSSLSYIAVNGAAYAPYQQAADKYRALNCKGPAPACPIQLVQDAKATCVQKMCTKVLADEKISATTCQYLVNTTFSSVQEHGCGMVPAGQPAIKCHFELKFKGSTYEWGHDDMIDQGSYTCANNIIKAFTSYPYGDINATYDPATKILKWKDGEEYRRL